MLTRQKLAMPVMRKQRAGLIITISSTAGLTGFEFGTAYAASKFGLEGWMESLQAEDRNRSALIPLPSIRDSFAQNFSPRNQRISYRADHRGLQTRRQSEADGIFGKATTVSSLATQPNSRRH